MPDIKIKFEIWNGKPWFFGEIQVENGKRLIVKTEMERGPEMCREAARIAWWHRQELRRDIKDLIEENFT